MSSTIHPQATPASRIRSRFTEAMRWVNPTLVHNDPGRYDPQFWLDYIKASKCDALSLNAGGIVAFYPTKLAHHKRNEWMGDTDPFGELIEGARSMGLIVTARIDHHATYEETAIARPEWIAAGPDGKPRRHWAKPELFVTCALGPYNYDFMTSVIREVTEMYMVDGFNQNRWGGQGVCYCNYCRTSFRAYSGEDIPVFDGWEEFHYPNQREPIWHAYTAWRQARILELWDLWDSTIRSINPNAGLMPGMGSEMTRLDMAEMRKRAHALYLDRQGRSGLTPPWIAGKYGKELRAIMPDKLVGLTFTVGLEEKYRWKDSVQSEAEIRIWAAEGIANGLVLKFCKFSGYLYDERWLDAVKDIYVWHHDNEPYLLNTRPLARVGVVYSQQTAQNFGKGAGMFEKDDSALGIYQALTEARVPFEMVHDRLLDEEYVNRFSVLVLPNIACLSDEQCEQIRGFVRRGGNLVATYQTALYNEHGEPRDEIGLSDLFGVRLAGPAEGPMRNSYLRLEHDAPGGPHPILKGLERAGRIINGVYRVPVTAAETFPNPPVTFIPPYPDLPMEEVYPREDHTGIPEVYLRTAGSSRIAYVPWDIDRVFWEILAPDHGKLLANIVEWACGEERPATVTGPGLVDVTVWEQQQSMTVHLVNLNNSMAMKGPFREIVPVGAQRVHIRLPQGRMAKRVKLLKAGGTVPYTLEGDTVSLTVPSIADHEVVAIDFE
jgi:hypothetical protein